MKKLTELVKRIILGSSLVVSSTPTVANSFNEALGSLGREEEVVDRSIGQQVLRKPLLILKSMVNSSSDFFAGHRSHRSHSSHRSHYSSRTGGAYETPQKSSPKQLGERTLKKGMEGEDVNQLEELLKKAGYDIEPDQKFDEKTQQYVKDFQSKNGIEADGQVGALTLSYLRVAGAKSTQKPIESTITPETESSPSEARILQRGLHGVDVLELETQLVKLGYALTPDSLFDELTEVAIKDYQAIKGIPANGKVGPLTVYHIRKDLEK